MTRAGDEGEFGAGVSPAAVQLMMEFIIGGSSRLAPL